MTALTNEQKLYAVTIERTIMVVAVGESEAERLAEESEREELMNTPDFVRAVQASRLSMVPTVWRDCFPYGGDGKLNCQDFLTALDRLQEKQP